MRRVLSDKHACSLTFNCIWMRLSQPPRRGFIIKRLLIPAPNCVGKQVLFEYHYREALQCGGAIIPPCAIAGFSAIHHSVCIGVIFLCAVGISPWCRIFVDCCLWKPIITERRVPLSEFDFHAEKVCEAKCNSAELPLKRLRLHSEAACLRSASGTCSESVPERRCRGPTDGVPSHRHAFTSTVN